MSSTTVRIDRATRDKLRELANREKAPMHVVLNRAVEAYRRKCFLEEANRAYAALREDPGAWKSEREEREAWDTTLTDGL